MAKHVEIKALLEPLLKRYPDWRYDKRVLFALPVGYYLRGCSMGSSGWDANTLLPYRTVVCLFSGSLGGNGFGARLWSGGTSRWSFRAPDFAENLFRVIEEQVIPATADVRTGESFAAYLKNVGQETMPGWPDWPAALAAVHMGDLKSAARHLDTIVEIIERQFPERQFPDFRRGWPRNAYELRRLIADAPDRIPAHCEAVARQAIAERKLEKYWQPTPFWGAAERRRALGRGAR